jgi:hypothetical protein
MKTTIELPDDLLTEAKAVAARRRTTLKAMMEHALRREMRSSQPAAGESKCFTIDEHGLPMVRKKPGTQPVTSELVYKMMEDLGI